MKIYPELTPILNIESVTEFFRDVDIKANVKKRLFSRLGTSALILVTFVLVLLSWRLSLAILSISFPFWLEFSSAMIGVIAILIQLYLFFKNSHQSWLYSRYVAEKTRMWKFQLLLDGEFVSNYLQSPNNFELELEKRWIIFKEEFKHGLGSMNEFIESQPLELMIKPTPYTDKHSLSKIKEAYQMLRIDVQITHFSNQFTNLEFMDKLTDGWAKVLLGISGALAVVEACLLGLQAFNPNYFQSDNFIIISAILAGVSLTFAIISAAIRVYRSASAIAEERERYRSKQNHLKRIKDLMKNEKESDIILSLMIETENLCNEELQEFLILLRRADYFF